MKIPKIFKSTLFITAFFLTNTAFAYSPEMTEQECKKPRITDFNLSEYKAPEYIEVAPESEFFFKVSVWADPKTITVEAKKQDLPISIESTTSFHKVKVKLPATLTGFVRINVSVKAILGCDEQHGWLVKVAEK